MYDERQVLKPGSVITHAGIDFEISGLVGLGGSAAVYTARYKDSLIEGGVHNCIIKELFPYRREGGIYRAENGELICENDAREFFEIHKTNFIRSNKIHLQILKENPDSLGANFNSFEQNNTIYSVLGLNSVSVLRNRAGNFENLSEILQIIVKLLNAAAVFHKNNVLHLDISPDNIILSESNGETRVLLIDFNSCMFSDNVQVGLINANPKFSAPELKLGRTGDISEATDIFSVCAVFAYLIDGGEFVYNTARLSNLEKSDILKSVPQSAVNCLLNILSKGLRSNPARRFVSASEMLEACRELQNRIDNIGVTRASIWEASRLIYTNAKEEWLENNISSENKIIPARSIFSLGNTILTGEGGIGKTTLYKRLWYENIRRYKANEPIYFYVPLNQYDYGTDFIKRYVVSKTKFGGGISTIADAVKKLTELMNGNEPFLNLMLDGLNEISVSGTNLIREIADLASMKGVTVSVSVRTDTLTEEHLKDFTLVSLMPLSVEQVKTYFNNRALACPDDADIVHLLTNPLMLTLYAKTESVFQKSGGMSTPRAESSGIIHSYLLSLAEAYKQSSPEDIEGQIRLAYISEHLFPALCAKAQKRAALDYETVRKICVKDYKHLCSRSFSRAFKKYAGKAREITGGAKNADEWMDIALNQILIRDTVLMKNENGAYYPLHMNFADCLAEDYKRNIRRYRKAALGIRIPVTALILTAALIISGIICYCLPECHPMGKREIKNNYDIMTTVARSLNNITQMTVNEEILIEQLGARDFAESLLYLEKTEEKLNALGSAEVETDNISEKAYRGLNTELVEKILSMSEQHRSFQKEMFERLKYAMSPDSIYTQSDIKKELEYYESYLSAYEKLTGYELCMLTRTINDKGGRVIKETMKGRGNIVMSFNNALEIKTEDLENSINSLELELKSLEAKLGLIQGGDL